MTSILRTLAGGDASADGRFGFTFGWLTRQSDGAWRFIADGGASSPPSSP
jgi:hypothetical protein